jgi:hypothetical protein
MVLEECFSCSIYYATVVDFVCAPIILRALELKDVFE